MSEFVAVARLADLTPFDPYPVSVAGKKLVVTIVEGEVYALDNVCSHDMAPLDEGTVDGYELCCPRHEGRFDVRTGKGTCFPAVWPIHRYPVRVEGDAVLVSVAEPAAV